jgi:hypothetical protein
VDEYLVQPAVGGPRPAELGERVVRGHLAVLDDPLADGEVPPDVGVEDRHRDGAYRDHQWDGV